MKLKYVALAISVAMSSGLMAAENNKAVDINQRLAQLEQRLMQAEQRASAAEAQIQTLQQQQVAAVKSAPSVQVGAAAAAASSLP